MNNPPDPDAILARYVELQAMLAEAQDPDNLRKLSQEYSEIAVLAGLIQELRQAESDLANAEILVRDPEMREMAETEIQTQSDLIVDIQARIQQEINPKNALDNRPAILEIRPGAGGKEASLFVDDLMRMYERYAEARKWKFELVDDRNSVASIKGKGVFARLQHESGVHRVQRVPETESQGRIHTSTTTVAVLPEADEVEIQIRDEDIRIDTMRASGPGGQHANKTDSAVRITHIPTGLIVVSSEKSQHRNKSKAMAVLRARLYEMERMAKDTERSGERRSQIGTGDRSERIRTYNFPQGRVTDHRISLTVQNLPSILDGNLDCLLDPLAEMV